LLARETLELARLIFHLLRELTLTLAALRTGRAHLTEAIRLAASALVLLL
jgi:hypothetical protein